MGIYVLWAVLAFADLPASASVENEDDVVDEENDPRQDESKRVPAFRFGEPTRRTVSNGRGLIIAGAITSGVGVLNAATLPLCMLTNRGSFVNVCFAVSGIVAGVMLLVGVPLLIAGIVQANTYKRTAAIIGGFDLAVRQDGASLFYRYAF
jgi:hypothetical protein